MMNKFNQASIHTHTNARALSHTFNPWLHFSIHSISLRSFSLPPFNPPPPAPHPFPFSPSLSHPFTCSYIPRRGLPNSQSIGPSPPYDGTPVCTGMTDLKHRGVPLMCVCLEHRGGYVCVYGVCVCVCLKHRGVYVCVRAPQASRCAWVCAGLRHLGVRVRL